MRSGRSFATTSPSRRSTNSVTKMTRLQKPSRCCLKRCQTRLHGDGEAGSVLLTILSVQAVELDAGVDEDIADVRNEFGHKTDQREQEQRAGHAGIVAAT